jgi:hypothetical protein
MPTHIEFPVPGDSAVCRGGHSGDQRRCHHPVVAIVVTGSRRHAVCAGHAPPERDHEPRGEQGCDDWQSQTGEGQHYGPF